jgi:hypothetical protein
VFVFISHLISSLSLSQVHDSCERVAFAFSSGVPDSALGAQCALLKVSNKHAVGWLVGCLFFSQVQASKTFEFCAREAVQVKNFLQNLF